jgi:hypothetical protein
LKIEYLRKLSINIQYSVVNLQSKPATAADIAAAMSKSKDDVVELLETMSDKGLCQTFQKDGVRYYLGAPFMPGIFEYQFMPGRTTERDKKIARLIHAYKQSFSAAKGQTRMTFPFICNCDRWHCEVIKGVLKQPKPSFFSTPDFSRALIRIFALPAGPASSAVRRRPCPWVTLKFRWWTGINVSAARFVPPDALRKPSRWWLNPGFRSRPRIRKN